MLHSTNPSSRIFTSNPVSLKSKGNTDLANTFRIVKRSQSRLQSAKVQNYRMVGVKEKQKVYAKELLVDSCTAIYRNFEQKFKDYKNVKGRYWILYYL